MPVPLLDAAHHRRLVGGAHDDPVLGGPAVVLRVVLGERPAPDRRPEVVALQAQHDLEHLRVEVGVEAVGEPRCLSGAEVGGGPGAERRVLVVDEDAPVLHRRGPLGEPAGLHPYVLAPRRRHVVPPVPGRDADAVRDVVRPEDRAARITARDDERPLHAGHRVLHDGLERGLPLAAHTAHVELAGPDQAVDQRTAADRADQHRKAADGRPRTHPGHPREVVPEVPCDPYDSRVILLADHHRRAHQGEHPTGERDVRPRVRHPQPSPGTGPEFRPGRGPCHRPRHRGQPGAQNRPAQDRPTADVRRRHTTPLRLPHASLFAQRHDK